MKNIKYVDLGYRICCHVIYLNMLFLGIFVQVDPSTGEAEDDGVEDEYQLEDFEVVAADYMLKVGVSNFKNAWENMPDFEHTDEYGLGPRESLTEAVNAVINLLGMQPCEVSALQLWCDNYTLFGFFSYLYSQKDKLF